MSAQRWPLSPAAVALELVEPDERTLAAQLLADDPAFRAEVARLRATTAALVGLDDELWAPPAPPALDHRGEAAAAATAAVPPRRRVRRRRAWAGAAALAAAVVLALVLVTNGSDDPGSTTLALRPLPGVSGRAQLIVNGAGTEAELRASGLAPSGEHEYYEAWLADARGRMVSMGTFRVSETGRVDVHMGVAVDLEDYALVDVSVEPDDGDPAHSDRSVLRARLS